MFYLKIVLSLVLDLSNNVVEPHRKRIVKDWKRGLQREKRQVTATKITT